MILCRAEAALVVSFRLQDGGLQEIERHQCAGHPAEITARCGELIERRVQANRRVFVAGRGSSDLGNLLREQKQPVRRAPPKIPRTISAVEQVEMFGCDSFRLWDQRQRDIADTAFFLHAVRSCLSYLTNQAKAGPTVRCPGSSVVLRGFVLRIDTRSNIFAIPAGCSSRIAQHPAQPVQHVCPRNVRRAARPARGF